MLNFNNTRIDRSVSRSVDPSTLVTTEGAVIVRSGTNVKTGTGAAGETFLGFSYSQQNSPTSIPQVESFVVPASGIMTLTGAPTSSAATKAWFVAADGSLTDVTHDADDLNPAAGSYAVVAKTLTCNTADAGKTIRIQYRFAPTVAQAQFLQGGVLPGGDSGQLLGTVGIILAGDVFTTEFDPSVDWADVAAAGTALTIGAGGVVTTGGAGGAVAARVISIPSAGSPYLGLSVDNG